jgi:hypothetical protein
MARPVREAMAHAAAPWTWRSRSSVVALVVAAIAIPAAFLAEAVIDSDGTNRFVALVWYGGFGLLFLIRPALRSLGRWDQAHDPS